MGIVKRSTRDMLLSTFLSFQDVDWEETLYVDEFIERRPGTAASFNYSKWMVKMADWAEVSYPLFLEQWSLKQLPPIFSGCHRLNGILDWSGPGRRICPD